MLPTTCQEFVPAVTEAGLARRRLGCGAGSTHPGHVTVSKSLPLPEPQCSSSGGWVSSPAPTSAHLWGATFHVNLTCVPSKRVIVNKSRQHLKGRELQFVTKCVRMAHFRPSGPNALAPWPRPGSWSPGQARGWAAVPCPGLPLGMSGLHEFVKWRRWLVPVPGSLPRYLLPPGQASRSRGQPGKTRCRPRSHA